MQLVVVRVIGQRLGYANVDLLGVGRQVDVGLGTAIDLS
jgi:hypothetical protein